MSTQSQIIENAPTAPPPQASDGFHVSERLRECSTTLRDHIRGPLASRWLIDNYSLLQSQIADLRHTLRPAFLRKLPLLPNRGLPNPGLRDQGKKSKGEPRIHQIASAWLADIAAEWLAKAPGVVDSDVLMPFAQTLRETHSLEMVELWAFAPLLKFAVLERLCANLEIERVVAGCVRTVWAMEAISWKAFVETASRADAVLREDPAGVYPRMDFSTRDRYRLELKRLARRAKVSEEEVAKAAVQCAEQARVEAEAQLEANENTDTRRHHVGYYLLGPGAQDFRRTIGCKVSPADLIERYPNVSYATAVAILTALVLAAFAWMAGPIPWWAFTLLLIPTSQAALEIANAAISRLRDPRIIPCMDFADAIPDDCKTMVVVPTLLLSEAGCTKLLKDLEIRYLANRDRNLVFALLTDFSDAGEPTAEGDGVLNSCADGIRKLNELYGSGERGPFYLLHRARRWNPQERKWMGFERKRGKLNDLNKLLLGRGNWFDTIVGDLSRLLEIRFVITLDTDTQLPRDTAAKMVAALAHPLNRAILDPATNAVTEGYALLRPQVAISVNSARRSWIASIFSGQPGFDPYASSVSDVYHDLHGQASFTGKGIYDVRAFDAAVGERFPENAILSHDLIEGEHARTGLINVELVEDYPATYGAFSKRKHRWVRGDWQLLPWLSAHPPVPSGRAAQNPLSVLSRWKILDNLRRSLLEISLLLLLLAGWFFAPHPALWTVGVLLLCQLPAYADMLLSIIRAPERRFLKAFSKLLGGRFLESHRDTLLNLVFIPYQACLMADAIARTLWRRYVSGANLLEWETMAQAELGAGPRFGIFERYLYVSSLLWLPFLFVAGPLPMIAVVVCALWVTAPLVAMWLNESLPKAAPMPPKDREFLREAALRTWRYFADHCSAENHWLVPDNVQEDPPLVAHNISPTNLGLSLTAQLAAHDFGYLSLEELSNSIGRILESMDGLPRYRGHFFNWYETGTRRPLAPQYVSSVDSGNLAASLATLRQGCLLLLAQPILEQGILEGLRDHVRRLRDEVPYEARSFSTMRLFGNLLRQLECQPRDLFFWEAVLTESRDLLRRIQAALVSVHARFKSDELRYWEGLLAERFDAALDELYQLAPWLTPAFEGELRVSMRDATFTPLLAELSRVPSLAGLPAAYDSIRERLRERLSSSRPLYPALRDVLEQLLDRLPGARDAALELANRFKSAAGLAQGYFDAMDFGFLFDENRQLLRIGYNVTEDRADQSCYDLLASEARTAVFLAIAKGDIPRETWLRLGRKLTAYRDHVTLLAWSGTMFEYLMPQLHLRSYAGTLLDRSLRAAVRIQQAYGDERNVPWGISEAAHSQRDHRGQYQYRAFGVPPLSASGDAEQRLLVIAPYATMLALMLDPARATVNLRAMAAKGWWSRHGFFESVDYSGGGADGTPEVVRCFMAHHQGMALLAIDNALLGNRMQERFHNDPLVQSTEFLLEERMPVLVDVTPMPELEAVPLNATA
jgi:cyclic beta-1,2-glucan synthetase